MSYFSAALDSAMRERGLKQTQLARQIGMDQPQVSRYLSADTRPDHRALERICQALPDHTPFLLAAYVRDEIPHFGQDLVTVTAQPETSIIAETPPQPPSYSRLPARVRQLIDEIAEKCERSPELVTALESMMDLTRER